MERQRLGVLLVVVAVVGLVMVMAVSAATAPSQEVSRENQTATLVGVQGGGLGYHHHGNVQLVDQAGRRVWTLDDANSYFDVTMLDNGTVLAGFMDDGYTSCAPYDPPCTHTGFRKLDPQANDPVVFEYGFPVWTPSNSETHDVERLPSGEFLVTDMEYERIYTVDRSGTITWQWDASTFYDAPPDPRTVDWLHINDVDALGNDRYLVSVRNANQILVVERGKGVVDVINRDRSDANDDACTYRHQLYDYNGDGNVRCGDPTLLDHQHNPQWLTKNAILVADSGNDRVVELHRNGTDGKWFVAWGIDTANGLQFKWPRDADRLANGNTLITDSRNKRVVEVTKNGSVVWSTTFEYIPYEADRLPEGETVGGQVYNPERGNIRVDSGGGVPVLTPLLGLVGSAYPLPYWITVWHLLAVFVAFVSIVAGGTLVLSEVELEFGFEN